MEIGGSHEETGSFPVHVHANLRPGGSLYPEWLAKFLKGLGIKIDP
jgi:hypothetical protein